MSDISGIVRQSGVALESQAFSTFGAAVSNQVGPRLSGLFGGPQAAPSANPNSAETVARNAQNGVWDSTRYATSIVDSAGIFPKTKFLFTIEFKFHPSVAKLAASIANIDTDEFARDLSFVIKQIDLPTYEFEYEQVNMYNFKTKILKQINHRELNLSFYDDNKNSAMDFVRTYLEILVPISRRSDYPLDTKFDDHGFAFSNVLGALNTSMRNPLPGNAKEILSELKINQFYHAPRSSPSPTSSILYNTFTFTNPRLSNIDISDQDHEQSGPNTIAAVFDFDSINITTGKLAKDYRGIKFPLGDIMNASATAEAQVTRGNITSPGKTRNPFVDIISRQGQRLVQTSSSSLLNRSFGGVAGGALGGSIYQVTGALGNATNRTLGNVGSSAAGSISIPRTPFVRDNSASSAQSINLSSQVISNDGWGEG